MVGRGPPAGVSRIRRGDPDHADVEQREAGGTFFLLAAPASVGDTVDLPREEAHHATRVLRLSGGSTVAATDGAGGRYRVRLHRRGAGAVGEILEAERLRPEPPEIEVGLGAGRRERFLWAVEKLTELAVAAVVPLLSAAVQGRKGRAAAAAGLESRARSRAAAALKQSFGTRLPRLESPVDAVAWASRPFDGLSLVLSLPAAGASALAAIVLQELRADSGLVGRGFRLAIGPEGGFLPDEERALRAAGFRPAHLGARRLRFETAAVAGVASVRAVMSTEGTAWSS